MKSYELNGVCSKIVNFDIIDNKIYNVSFIGGCAGNLKGISKLIEGMTVEEVILRLEGITCGGKSTSCPDQFSQILSICKNASEQAS